MRSIGLVFVLFLAGCASVPASHVHAASPCQVSEASYECQVERYHKVNVP